MRLCRIEVADFGCIESAAVEFGPGLNVLYGPNDLGKTTLASAVRAALLLQPSSSAAQDFRPWHNDRDPRVNLEFEHGGRFWRVEKTWSASSTRRRAALQWSVDGATFQPHEEARGVDGKLRELLGWGVAPPGGRGGARGLPRSFLASILLGEQSQPYGVFDLSLAEDTDDSAKTKLRAVLEAMAADPLYERVLEQSQARVSEAFTDKGARSTRRDSPFRRMAEDVQRRREAAETWEKRRSESEAVEQRLADLDGARERLMRARSDAVERRDRLRQEFDRAATRAREVERWQRAKQRVDELEQTREEIAKLEREAQALRDAIPGAREACLAAAREHELAQEGYTRARALVQQLQQGGSPEQRLERRNGEHRQLELQAALRDVDDRARRLTDVDRLEAELARVEQELATRATEHETCQARVDAAEAALAEALARQQQVRRGLAWHRYAQAEAAARDAETAVREQAKHRAEAAMREAEAQALRDAAAASVLPRPDELAALERIAAEQELARAALGGGLELRLALVPGCDASLSIDAQPVDPAGERFEVQREFTLVVPGAGTIAVRAGERDARAALQAAERAFEVSVAPVLARTGCPDLTGVAAEVRRREGSLERARNLDVEARAARERAAACERLAVQHPALRERAAELRSALDDADAAADEAVHGSERALQAEAQRLEAQLDALRSEQGSARDAMARLTAEHGAADDRRARLRDELTRALAAVGAGEDVDALRRAVAEQRENLTRELASVVAALEAWEASRGRALAEAEQAVLRSEAEVEEHRRRRSAAEQAVAELEDRRGKAQGALGVLRQRLATMDVMATAEAFARATDELERCPPPTFAVDEAMLAAAQDEVARIEAELEGVDTEFRQQQGALQQLGGEVVRERATLAREAFERALREEAEVELEYEAWRLLLTTLREAENDEGRHVGQLLARSVSEHVERLTSGRYGALALGPELETLGLHTATGLKPVKAFSEGLKEQLATLLRISVAEQLQGTLLLDDHLAQTDPLRVAWFRDLLRDRGEVTQILLLTCRPLEYLREEQLASADGWRDLAPRMRAVELAKFIQRAR